MVCGASDSLSKDTRVVLTFENVASFDDRSGSSSLAPVFIAARPVRQQLPDAWLSFRGYHLMAQDRALRAHQPGDDELAVHLYRSLAGAGGRGARHLPGSRRRAHAQWHSDL